MKEQILFFDGVCGLCNSFVDVVIQLDGKGRYKFSPLQGETARRLLSAEDVDELNTFVFWQDGQAYRRSTAALKVLTGLGGIWTLLGVFFVIPRPLRDVIYDWVARNRYRWFGKKESCRIPTPEERARFLD